MPRLLVDLHHASVSCWEADASVFSELAQETSWQVERLPSSEENLTQRQRMLAAGATALWTWHAAAAELAHCPGLRWVATPAAGADYLPVAELRALGLTVTCSHGHHGPAMAEHAWGMVLALARDLHRRLPPEAWLQTRAGLPERVIDIQGAGCLLLGYGGIGRHLASRALAFGAEVFALRQGPAPDEAGVRMLSRAALPAILPRIRVVVNSLPGGPATQAFCDEAFFGALPAPAVLVNVGRGSTVDETALLAAVQAGRLRAGLDVTATEPLPANSPLWQEPDVVLSPHAAAITPAYLHRAAVAQRQQMQRFVAGQPLLWLAGDEGAPQAL